MAPSEVLPPLRNRVGRSLPPSEEQHPFPSWEPSYPRYLGPTISSHITVPILRRWGGSTQGRLYTGWFPSNLQATFSFLPHSEKWVSGVVGQWLFLGGRTPSCSSQQLHHNLGKLSKKSFLIQVQAGPVRPGAWLCCFFLMKYPGVNGPLKLFLKAWAVPIFPESTSRRAI